MSGEATGVEKSLEAIDRFVYRNRHLAGPPAVGLLMAALAYGAHLAGLWWAAAIVAAVVLALAADAIADLPSAREKIYASVCWAGAALWVVGTAWVGPALWLWIVLTCGVVALGIPWAYHRRVRRGVDVDRAIAAWGDGNAVGLAGTRARGTKAGQGWWSFKLAADEPGRYTLADYKQRAHRIAAKFGVRSEAISFAESPHEGEVEVTVRDSDRPTTEVEVTSEASSIIGAHRIGATDSGEPIAMAFYLADRGAIHGAGVGATGSGKSSLVNAGCKIAAEARDAVLWIVDLSYGAVELRRWAGVCDWFAYTTAHVDAMLDALPAMCAAWGQASRDRVRTPSADDPAIVLWIDEGASVWAPDLVEPGADSVERRRVEKVAKTRRDKAGELARLARKYGVAVHQMTQYGDQAALGGPAVKQQLQSGYASVFYSGRNTDGHLLIPASHGVKCSEFPQSKPGTVAMKGPTIAGVVTGRVDYTTDEHVAATVEQWRGQQPALPTRIASAGGHAYATRNRHAPGNTGGDTTGGDSGESTGHKPSPPADGPDFTVLSARAVSPRDEGTPGRLSPEESRRLVWDTLAGLGEAGPSELATACGKSPQLVKARLDELRATGWVSHTRRGRWAIVSHASHNSSHSGAGSSPTGPTGGQ